MFFGYDRRLTMMLMDLRLPTFFVHDYT